MLKTFHLDKTGSMLGIAAALVLTQPTLAGDMDLRAFGGSVACGGNHFDRLGGTEAHRTGYVVKNYNPKQSVFIDRVQVFDAQGNSLFDSNVSGLPTFGNNVLGPTDNDLGPNQTAVLYSWDVLSEPLGVDERPMQVVFTWTADGKVLVPDIVLARITRERLEIKDPAGNVIGEQLGEERARALGTCRHIAISKGKGGH